MTKAEVNVSRETFPLLFSSSDTRCFPVSLFHNRLFSACRFSSLSDHAARQSGNLKRFRGGENGEGSAELWAAARHKALERKKRYRAFFSLFLRVKALLQPSPVTLHSDPPFQRIPAFPRILIFPLLSFSSSGGGCCSGSWPGPRRP